jgi:hypothetical protein
VPYQFLELKPNSQQPGVDIWTGHLSWPEETTSFPPETNSTSFLFIFQPLHKIQGFNFSKKENETHKSMKTK